MKVLWFANNPCGAIEKLGIKSLTGGWLKSLEDKLVENDEIELTVCFYWNRPLLPFKHKRTYYYPIFRNTGNNKIIFHLKKYFPQINDNSEIPLLIRVINSVKPDIIHIHGTEDNFGLIQKFTEIPCVISIQGLLSPCLAKYHEGISKTIVNKHESFRTKLIFTPISITYNNLKKRSLREQIILLKSKHIIGRTNWDKRISGLLAPNSTYYLGNEMLRPVFYEKQWKRSNLSGTIHIVTVLGGALYKGLETIVQVAGLLKKSESIDFRWQVIGIDENQPVAKIVKSWLRICYATLNIELVGKKNEDELSELLVHADLYCQSSHIENSPNSLCEAMLIGMPIVASFAGGTDSMLENNKEGILVQAGDYYSFAGAIKNMTDNPEKALVYAKNAREKAIARHDPNKIVPDLIKTYKSIVENEKDNK